MEWHEPYVHLHRASHPGVPVVHGDICDPSCLKEVAQRIPPPFTMMCGISCQPYFTQTGSNDERSNAVRSTVRACHLFQCPVMILEGVTQARTNQYVRSHLQVLAQKLGYHIHEMTLRLEGVWRARRFRWWVVATHPSLCPVKVPDWPKHPTLTIRDVMPFVKHWLVT
jgi:site-specific DNA-cytosine methylase